jgi:hypothetical protein
LRIVVGSGCSSQKADTNLRAELANILRKDRGMLVGIPNFAKNARHDVWDKYAQSPFASYFKQPQYASAFITRPDNAPWIDRPDYWAKVRRLWAGRDVVLVAGDRKSITGEMLKNAGSDIAPAASCDFVEGPRKNAYDVVDKLEKEIVEKTPVGGLVLLCLGAAATALAARLDRRGIQALDLGHIGMFMRHAGAFVDPATLISKAYKRQNVELHRRPEGFGGDGKKHAERILEYARELGARSICDYGCGEGTLKATIVPLGWSGFFAEYDPGMPGKEHLPKPVQLVACTDVLEHIEPEYLDAVLAHMYALAEIGAFLSIATRPANKVLPDGRNAHLIQESPQWWVDKLVARGWHVVDRYEKTKDGKAREVWLWLTKKAPASTGAPT